MNADPQPIENTPLWLDNLVRATQPQRMPSLLMIDPLSALVVALGAGERGLLVVASSFKPFKSLGEKKGGPKSALSTPLTL